MPPRPKLRPPAALPEFVSPQLATLTDKAPAGDGWLHEIKLDGYRTAARLEAGKVRMLTRSGLDWTARFRPIAAALAGLKARAAYLDGEIAVLGEGGVTSFAALQDALSRGQAERLTYHVFNLLHLDGRDLTALRLIERKALLAPLLARLPKGSSVRYSDHVAGQGPAFFAQACKHQLEGIVSKRAAAPYRSRRTEDWLKVKCLNRQEFVIGGWMASDKPGRSLRSLLLGYHDRGKLVFAGKAGTGFGLAAGRELAERLRKIERDTPPFASVPRAYQSGSRWVAPRLVAEVTFTTWTTDLLRHPSFEGLREDKSAREVKFERPSHKAS
jgi:bifunctional non-homologous end joining protein LigD